MVTGAPLRSDARMISLGLGLAVVLTAMVALVNLWSAITPSPPAAESWFLSLWPIQVRVGAHLFSALSGFFLLTLATNLGRRKRIAWWLTIGLLSLSAIGHLIRGLHYQQSLLSLVLLALLLWLRPAFVARSDRPSIIQGVRVLLGALLFTLAYGTLGLWWLDHHYSTPFSLAGALTQTLAMFFTADNGGLRPTTAFGGYFARSIYGVGAVTLMYAVWMLFRPVILRETASPAEHQRARAIVEQYGHSSLARITLLEDKSYYFSPSGQTVIAYLSRGRGAIALGDPIGPEADLKEAILGFRDFCQTNDWHPAFYQTLADHVDLYQTLGFRILKIGEEAVIDLHQFTLKGKAGRSLRPAVNKCLRQGYRVVFYQPPLSDRLLLELKAISDDWLRYRQGAEKKFSLGWFDPDYLETCVIAAVEDSQGKTLAFANLIPEYQLNEATIDLMRYHHEALPGTMDYLLVSLIQYCQKQGYDQFNLGLAAFADQVQTPHLSRLNRGIRYLYNHLNQLYNFHGLRAYKEKFHPRWQPRYLVYSHRVSLPEIIVALVRVDSGDRLQDYLGVQFFSNALSQWLKGFSRLLPALLSLGLFSLCIWAIIHELQKYQPQVILNDIRAIPYPTLILALGLTALNYGFLTGYDVLARFFVNHRLSYRKTALVATISYAISNSVGFALLSGSAIRYRFYAAWGLTPGQIAQIIAFCNLSFWIGLLAVGGLVFAVEPLTIPSMLHLPFDTVHPLGILFLIVISTYLGLSSWSRRPLKIGDWIIPRLPLRLSLAQIAVTSCDWALAASVLYVLLPADTSLPYLVFFSSYLLAEIAGVMSNVPGGLGVFETVLILLLSPPLGSDALLGSLLMYRVIYYLTPLLLGMVLLASYELYRHPYRRRLFPASVRPAKQRQP